jgi:hypothetical protein
MAHTLPVGIIFLKALRVGDVGNCPAFKSMMSRWARKRPFPLGFDLHGCAR